MGDELVEHNLGSLMISIVPFIFKNDSNMPIDMTPMNKL
jgi:hypothetical protein